MTSQGQPTTLQQIGSRRAQVNNKRKRELQRLFREELPRLLQKPAKKWSKTELWNAIELYIKWPYCGLLAQPYYVALEVRLKREPVDSHFSLPHKKGRPHKYTKEEYQMQWKVTQGLRQQIATERGVAIDKVHYKDVAWGMAERSFARSGLQVPDYKIRSLAARFETHYKALNKKKKLGEI